MRTPIALTGFALLLTALTAAAAENPRTPSPATSIEFGTSTSRAFDRSGRHVTTRRPADGSTSVSLNGSFQNVTVARLGPDGTIETHCTTDALEARAWMAREDGRPSRVRYAPATPGDAP